MWWDGEPTTDMEMGLAHTAEIFDLQYERVQSINDANFRVWLDSWAYKCKWPTTHAFVSLDPEPSTCGSQTGDIYICRFPSPLTPRSLPDYAVFAHESAHIFAAQPHFGEGLMGPHGGKHSTQFAYHEIEVMRDRIGAFNTSVKTLCMR